MLTVENSLLLVVDLQERLIPFIHQKEELIKHAAAMIQGARILNIPVILTEQVPEKIGKTIPEITQLLPDLKPIKKISFSCCADAPFLQALGTFDRKQILLVGIETHVCVYQTSIDLINIGFDVEVVADAVSSRTLQNKEIGLGKIKEAGGSLTSTETALCELLRVAEGEKFKNILKLIK